MTRVVLTQPAPRADGLAARLRARGHDPLAFSQRRLVRCAGVPEPSAFVDSLVGQYDWVIFVSPGAVALALGGADEAARRWPATVGIAVVGPGSAQAMGEVGLAAPEFRLAVPREAPYDADALLATAPFDAPAGLAVLVVHGARGRRDWIDELRARGARVDSLVLYRSEPEQPPPEAVLCLRRWAGEAAPTVFVFTSVDGARDCSRMLDAQSLLAWARVQPTLVVHPRIADALSQLDWSAVRLIEPGEPALLAGIESA